MGKQFKPVYLLQFVAAIIFGWFTDFNKAIVPELSTIPLDQPLQYFSNIGELVLRFVMVIVGALIVGLGLCGYMNADIMAIPPDGLSAAIGKKMGKTIGSVKRVVDYIIVAVSLIIDLVVCHTYEGIFVGTIIAAFLVGTAYNWWRKPILKPLTTWMFGPEFAVDPKAAIPKQAPAKKKDEAEAPAEEKK